jgi:hypothetical protein
MANRFQAAATSRHIEDGPPVTIINLVIKKKGFIRKKGLAPVAPALFITLITTR